MSHPKRVASASPRRPRPPAHAITPVLRQNTDGDIVVPAEVGEIVLLPRLWGFEFAVDAIRTIDLVHPSGLTASADLDADGGLRLTEVVAPSTAVPELRLAAS